MPDTLRLGLDLKRVVASISHVVDVSDGGEWAVRRAESCAPRAATQRVPRDDTACARRSNIQVQTVHQNVVTARPRITRRQHEIPGQLVLKVEVELLNDTLLEIQILRLDCSSETSRVGRRCKGGGEAIDDPTGDGIGRSSVPKGARTDAEKAVEVVSFGEEGRVLPQPLRTLVPRRIMGDRIAGADCRFLGSKRFPGQSNAWLKCSLVQLNADPTIRVLSGDQVIASGVR